MTCLNVYYFNNQPVSVLIDTEGEPWFNAEEVAKILAYDNPKMAILCFVSAKYKSTPNEIARGCVLNIEQEYGSVFISKPGLYELMFPSNLQVAKDFKYWVFEEVLPSIRADKEATFRNEIQQLKDEKSDIFQTYIKTMEINGKISNMKVELEAENEKLVKQIETMNERLISQAPSVAVMPCDTFLKHVFCVLVNEEKYLAEYGLCEYICLRREKRTINHALKKAKEDGYKLCFMKEDVPSGINILNKCKEIMRSNGMDYHCTTNKILTHHNFINIVNMVLDIHENQC